MVVVLPNISYKSITNTAWVCARLCKLFKKKECTRLAATSDKVYQLLAHGRWFSPGTPASSTTKTGRHDIAEILLKVAVKTPKINQNQSIVVNSSFWRRKIRFMVFNAILNNISVISRRSVLLVEETGEHHRPVASH